MHGLRGLQMAHYTHTHTHNDALYSGTVLLEEIEWLILIP